MLELHSHSHCDGMSSKQLIDYFSCPLTVEQLVGGLISQTRANRPDIEGGSLTAFLFYNPICLNSLIYYKLDTLLWA